MVFTRIESKAWAQETKVISRKARYQSRMMTRPYTPLQHVRKMKDCSSLMNNLTLSDKPSSTSTSTSPLQQCQMKNFSSLMNNLTLSDGPSSTSTSSRPLQRCQDDADLTGIIPVLIKMLNDENQRVVSQAAMLAVLLSKRDASHQLTVPKSPSELRDFGLMLLAELKSN